MILLKHKLLITSGLYLFPTKAYENAFC